MRTDDPGRVPDLEMPEAVKRRRRGVALCVGAMAAAVLTLALRRERPERQVPEVRPIGLELDAAGTYVVQGTRGHGRLLFSDGSRVVAGRGTRVRLLPIAADAVDLELVNGELYVEIEPGLRVWTIVAGPYSVRGRAGALTLAWLLDLRRFAVRVEQGELQIAGPGFPSARVLTKGAGLWLDDRGQPLREPIGKDVMPGETGVPER